MRLEHYTDEVFSFERRTYEQKPAMGMMKPIGLWVSVAGDDDWPSWCRSEGFALSSLQHLAVVTLVDDPNVLMISSAAELDAFHDEFAVDDDPLFNAAPLFRGSKRYWAMDWSRVAEKFDGFIVAPYLWSRRLDGPMWYYGMDCASGCIWNLDAIASVEVVR